MDANSPDRLAPELAEDLSDKSDTTYEMIAVVAEDSSRTIAVEGMGIPWHYPEDKNQYEELVANEHQLMGRKTYEQIKGVPNKESVVLTRDTSYSIPDPHIHIANSKEEAEEIISEFDDVVYNIGGSQIYDLFFDDCTQLIVSHIPEVADTEENIAKKFPPILLDDWEITEVKEFNSFERVTYRRK